MKHYLLLRTLSESEVENLRLKEDKAVYVVNETCGNVLDFPHEQLSLPKLGSLYKDSYELVAQFPHNTYGDKSIAKASLHRGVSLFYYTRFILFNRFLLAYKEWQGLQEFLNSVSKPSALTVYGFSPYLQKVTKDLDVSFVYDTGSNQKINKLSLAVIFALRTLVGVFYKSRLKRARHLFISPPVEKQPILNKETLEPEQGNPISDYFLSSLLSQHDSYVFEEYYPAKFVRFNISQENIFGLHPKKSIFFEPYLATAFIKSRFQKKEQKAYVAGEVEAFRIIEQQEQDIRIQLLNHINLDLLKMRKFALFRVKAAESFFKKNQLQSIGGIDEYSVRTKTILDSAIAKNILTYSIQHGIIHENHTGYKYHPNDGEFNNFVDKLFLFGSEAEALLKKHHYGGATFLSGQIRTDIIPKLKSAAEKIQISHTRTGHPLVVYASQPDLPGDEPNIRNSINHDFFRLCKDFPEVDFILKPHPREYDHNYFHNIAKKVKTTNYSIAHDDLYVLLSKCSALLTHCSSVGAEAVYFDKPLIVQDYKDVDVVNYIKEGVGIKATQYEELKTALEGILNSSIRPNDGAYQAYRNKFNGPIDGQAVQRILDEIN